jgi:hypothetical protein
LCLHVLIQRVLGVGGREEEYEEKDKEVEAYQDDDSPLLSDYLVMLR